MAFRFRWRRSGPPNASLSCQVGVVVLATVGVSLGGLYHAFLADGGSLFSA
jgi:hypothetical protein